MNRNSWPRAIAASFGLCALSLACGGGDPAPVEPPPPVTDTPVLTRTVIDSGLSSPWDIAFAADGGRLKGSGRSIAALHLRDALDLVDKRNPGLLERFGQCVRELKGFAHPRIAGLFAEALVILKRARELELEDRKSVV